MIFALNHGSMDKWGESIVQKMMDGPSKQKLYAPKRTDEEKAKCKVAVLGSP